jgi:hypothetical protein
VELIFSQNQHKKDHPQFYQGFTKVKFLLPLDDFGVLMVQD